MYKINIDWLINPHFRRRFSVLRLKLVVARTTRLGGKDG
jgi:hypothetical protein